MPLFFNATHLPPPGAEYVAWVDVMGTQYAMSRSLRITANFIFKLHIAALDAPRAGVRLYPVMDGIYAASPDQAAMLTFLRSVFSAAAEEFNSAAENQFRFVIRGGLAYGPTVHGSAVPAPASNTLAANAGYRDCVLLGMPMVQAHLSEASAPPFGIFVHESARAFAPTATEPLHQVWWRWENAVNVATWTALRPNLDAYFDWCANRSQKIGYAAERVAAHKSMVAQYFA